MAKDIKSAVETLPEVEASATATGHSEAQIAAPYVEGEMNARDAERKAAKRENFLNEFASNNTRRNTLERLFDTGLGGIAAADEFKPANRAYFIARYDETAKV